jgi:hypothetical protein
LTPQAQFRINKLNNALDGNLDMPTEAPMLSCYHQ